MYVNGGKSLTSPTVRPWLALALGGVSLAHVFGGTTLAATPWIAICALVYFTRRAHPALGLPTAFVVMTTAAAVALRGGFLPAGSGWLVTSLMVAAAFTVLFAADRVLTPRAAGLAGTLVLPCLSVVVGWLTTLGNPLGTAGSEAYAQIHPGLLQLLALTGIWGLVFLISWTASAVAGFPKDAPAATRTRSVLVVALVVVAVAVVGEARLIMVRQDAGTLVEVAALAPDPGLYEAARTVNVAGAGDLAAARSGYAPMDDDLLIRTDQQARAGAQLIVWSEAAAQVVKADEPALLERVRATATTRHVYVQIGLATLDIVNGEAVVEDRAVLITPTGQVAWDYAKAHLTPGDPGTPGPERLATVDTPFGRLATVICQDDLFPDYLAQAGRAGVDILLVPSSDWPQIAEYHAAITPFRAIENGLAVVRPTRHGRSVVVDAGGRVVASATSDITTVRATVRVSHVRTLYPRAPWLVMSIAGLGVLVAVARRFRIPRAGSRRSPCRW